MESSLVQGIYRHIFGRSVFDGVTKDIAVGNTDTISCIIIGGQI